MHDTVAVFVTGLPLRFLFLRDLTSPQDVAALTFFASCPLASLSSFRSVCGSHFRLLLPTRDSEVATDSGPGEAHKMRRLSTVYGPERLRSLVPFVILLLVDGSSSSWFLSL